MQTIKGYIEFQEQVRPDNLKTKKWIIMNKDGSFLGEIRWHGAWHKYVFYPCETALFDTICLLHISSFLAEKTFEQLSN